MAEGNGVEQKEIEKELFIFSIYPVRCKGLKEKLENECLTGSEETQWNALKLISCDLEGDYSLLYESMGKNTVQKKQSTNHIKCFSQKVTQNGCYLLRFATRRRMTNILPEAMRDVPHTTPPSKKGRSEERREGS